MLQNLSSAAVVIGALRVKGLSPLIQGGTSVMWKENPVFLQSKSYLNFCTSIGVHKKPSPRLSTVGTSSTHRWFQAIPEASSTIRAPQRALVSVIITLLNDSERWLNKKWLRPVTNKQNPPIGWKSKRKHSSIFSLDCSISYIHTKKHTSSFRKSNLKILRA